MTLAKTTVEDQHCPVCGAANPMVFLDGPEQPLAASDFGSSRKSVSHGRILRCPECQFGFSQFRPTDEQLSSLYRELDKKIYEQELPGRLRTARRHLEFLKRCGPPGRLLDVGCASGLFMKCAADAGWDVSGVEPSTAFYNLAREAIGTQGVVLHGTLQEVSLPTGFDVVTLWDVLEHVQHPVEFLRLCSSKLKSGGCLIVNVPNLDSIQARLLGEHWPLLLAEHLNYFNRSSLEKAAEQIGLKTVRTGQRPSSFSIAYLFFRLAQHDIPGAKLGHRLIQASPLRHLNVPVWLGELCVTWRAPAANT